MHSVEPASEISISASGPPDPPLAARLADIWVAAWSVTMPSIDFEARRDWIVCRFQHWPLTLIATNARGRISGFALLNPATGHLDQIAVAPQEFGGGAAHALLDAAKDQCAEGMTLEVNESNPRAIRFYEREGFQRIGRSVNPASRLPTIVMRYRPAR